MSSFSPNTLSLLVLLCTFFPTSSFQAFLWCFLEPPFQGKQTQQQAQLFNLTLLCLTEICFYHKFLFPPKFKSKLLIPLYLKNHTTITSFIVFILEMRKTRLRETKQLSQVHIASKWRIWGWNSAWNNWSTILLTDTLDTLSDLLKFSTIMCY